MVCVYCSSKTSVTNSRKLKRLPGTWRRRVCMSCNSIITTIEAIDYPTALSIQDSSGALSPFVRDRLFVDVYDSLKHRKTAQMDATALTSTIIGKVLSRTRSAVIKREELIGITSEVLKRFDHAASVQYLAFHPLKTRIKFDPGI